MRKLHYFYTKFFFKIPMLLREKNQNSANGITGLLWISPVMIFRKVILYLNTSGLGLHQIQAYTDMYSLCTNSNTNMILMSRNWPISNHFQFTSIRTCFKMLKCFRSGDGRGKKSVKEFAQKHELGDPVAGNFFQAKYDDYVPILYKQLGF